MSLCLIVDAAEPEEWLEAGWLFPGTGWGIYTQGEHTCFIRYVRRILGLSDLFGCFDVSWYFNLFFFFFYLNQLSSERGRVFPFRCPDAGVGRDLPGGRVLMMGSRRFPG